MDEIENVHQAHLTRADEVREIARKIAREEIASLCGLVLRRLGGAPNRDLEQIFGEALADFSGHTHNQQPGN